MMRFGLPLLVLLALAACSRDPAPSAAATADTPAAEAARSAGGDSVAAVAQGGVAGPVALRFVLDGRPVVGAASSLRLEFTAAVPLSGVAVRIEGEALGIDAAQSRQIVDLPEAGKTVSLTAGLTPHAAGITEAIVHVLPPGAESAETVYAIPVLVDEAAK